MTKNDDLKQKVEKEWEQLSSRLKTVFNYGIEKSEWLKNSRTAKFITAIPFLAGCEKASETAFAHLAIYLLSVDESAKEILFHKQEDDSDIYKRLFSISNFYGGDKKTIQCCKDLLVLNMVSNYKKDATEDKALGKYNPLNDSDWDYDKIANKLIQNINKSITVEISGYFSVEDALKGFWQD